MRARLTYKLQLAVYKVIALALNLSPICRRSEGDSFVLFWAHYFLLIYDLYNNENRNTTSNHFEFVIRDEAEKKVLFSKQTVTKILILFLCSCALNS